MPLGALPFPRLVREGGDFDLTSIETALAIHRGGTTRIMLGGRNSKSLPCRRKRDKDGAPDFR